VPTFTHHPERTLPHLTLGGATIRVLVGSAFDRISPVHSFSDIVYLDVQMPAGSRFTLQAGERELGVYSAQGAVRIDTLDAPPRSLAIGAPGQDLTLAADAPARIMIIGGKPFGERREIWWNFVSSSKDRIERAKADWAAGRFPTIPGDDREFIPLPAD
jgi:redox-sensitive bicupin YhaK (pirin superfamily)